MHYKLTCTLLQASPAEGSTATRHSNAYLIGNTHPEVASHLSVGVSPVKTIGESSGNTMVNMPIIRYAFLSVIALGGCLHSPCQVFLSAAVAWARHAPPARRGGHASRPCGRRP